MLSIGSMSMSFPSLGGTMNPMRKGSERWMASPSVLWIEFSIRRTAPKWSQRCVSHCKSSLNHGFWGCWSPIQSNPSSPYYPLSSTSKTADDQQFAAPETRISGSLMHRWNRAGSGCGSLWTVVRISGTLLHLSHESNMDMYIQSMWMNVNDVFFLFYHGLETYSNQIRIYILIYIYGVFWAYPRLGMFINGIGPGIRGS